MTRPLTRPLTRPATDRGERGAVLPMVAILLTVLLAVAAMGVDLGLQRVARRDMQALADVVAVDLGRLVDGRTAAQILSGSNGKQALATAVALSVSRNTGSVGDTPAVDAVLVNIGLDGRPVRDAAGGLVPVVGAAVPTGVYVTARTAVDFAFTTGRGAVSRSALGRSRSEGCFRLGSYALAVNSGNSALLNQLIGNALHTTVLGYSGLSTSSISYRGLATELGVGTPDQLVTLTSLSVRRLLDATANVLAREGGSSAQVSLLRSAATAVGGATVVDLSSVLVVPADSSSALSSKLNVLDLVASAAFVSNGTNFFDAGVLWNVPQFSTGPQGGAHVTMIEKPRSACGPVGTKASTAQVGLTADPALNLPTIAGLSGPKVDTLLNVQLASAAGTLTSVVCGQGTAASPDSVTVAVTRSLLSRVDLSVPIHLSGTLKVRDLVPPGLWSLLGLVGTGSLSVDIVVDAGTHVVSPPGSTSVTYAVPPHTWQDAIEVGTAGGVQLQHVALSSANITGSVQATGLLGLVNLNLSTQVDFTPVLTDLVQKNVVSGINGYIDNVNDQILTPLTQLLGVDAAGADLFGGPDRPQCDAPVLAG